FSKISAYFGPPGPHGRREIEHLKTRWIDAHVLQELFDMFHSFCCVCITFQVMTLPLESTCDEDAIHALFEGPQDIGMIEFPGAWHAYDLDACWISQPHDTGHICRGKSAIVAGKGDNVRLP